MNSSVKWGSHAQTQQFQWPFPESTGDCGSGLEPPDGSCTELPWSDLMASHITTRAWPRSPALGSALLQTDMSICLEASRHLPQHKIFIQPSSQRWFPLTIAMDFLHTGMSSPKYHLSMSAYAVTATQNYNSKKSSSGQDIPRKSQCKAHSGAHAQPKLQFCLPKLKRKRMYCLFIDLHYFYYCCSSLGSSWKHCSKLAFIQEISLICF